MSRSISAPIFTILLAALTSLGTLLAAPIRFIPVNDVVAATKIAIRDSKGLKNLKDLNSQKRSIAYTFKTGKTPLQLVAQDRKDAAGEPAAADILLPPEFKSPLVLILPDAHHPSGLRSIAIEDSNTGFPWGAMRFLNLTGSPLMCRYATETKSLPDGNTPTDVLPAGDAHNMGVQLFKEDAPDDVLYSAVWEHDPNFRKLIVITPGADPSTKALDLLILPEDRRAKKK